MEMAVIKERFEAGWHVPIDISRRVAGFLTGCELSSVRVWLHQ